MATWDGTFEATPAGSDAPSTIDDKIREFKEAVRVRIGNEHGNYSNTSEGGDGSEAADWVHKAGSGVAYYQSDAPTLRPDGVTGLDSTGSDDDGRVWVSIGTTRTLKVWSGGSWFSVGANANTVVNQGSDDSNITGMKVKTVSVGSWNMDGDASHYIPIGMSADLVRGWDLLIYADGGTNLHHWTAISVLDVLPNLFLNSGTAITSDVFQFARRTGGHFDSTTFNSASGNRGWLTYWYYE